MRCAHIKIGRFHVYVYVYMYMYIHTRSRTNLEEQRGKGEGVHSSRYCVYMHIGREASYREVLLSSCTRTLAVFQYSEPETLDRKARPSNPVARPTDRPPPPPLPSLASVHRTVIFGQNRTVSYLNVPPPLPPVVGSHMHAVFQRRPSSSSSSSR